MKADPDTGLLNSHHKYEIARNSVPVNLANSKKPGLITDKTVEIGFMTIDQTMYISVGVGGSI
jgi:hypothetical protein